MLSPTTYKPTTGFNLLLIGEPFSGKTTLATTFPAPGIVDCDGKFENARAFHAGKDPAYDFRVSMVDVDDTGKTVKPVDRWPRFLKCCAEMHADPWVKTIVLDSGTKIAQYLCDYIVEQPNPSKDLNIGGLRVMTQQMWYPFNILFQRMLADMLACGKNVIMTVHIRSDKDDVSGQLYYRPSVPGQTGETLGKLFTNYWFCKAQPVPPDLKYPRGVKYLVRTAPDARLSVGSAIPNLPPEFEFSIADFRKLCPWIV